MKRNNKTIILLLALIFVINTCGCSKKEKAASEKKQINIYVDVKDKNSLNIVKYLTDEYKKQESKVEINLINPFSSEKLEEDISKGAAGDVIITSRNTMIDLSRKGLLSNLSTTFSKNKISDKYYNIVSAYGRVGDKYFGLGIMPFTIEVFYNKESLKKLGMEPPKSITDLLAIFKKISENNLKVPVILPEDLDINNALASILFSNTSDLSKLEKKYDSGYEEYSKLTEIQKLFNDVYYLNKSGIINKDMFEVIGENSLSRLTMGDVPIVIGSSYIVKPLKEELKGDKIGVIEKYNISPVKENVPVIINSLICVPANAKNEEVTNSFIEYLFNEKTQKKLAEEGFVTGNKAANGNTDEKATETKDKGSEEKEKGTEKKENGSEAKEKSSESKDKGEETKDKAAETKKLEGVNKIIETHINQANGNSIIYLYNMPKQFQSPLDAKLNKIISGKYTGAEWEEILKEIYKR
jgi:ABC-type glycerol-3-phosphate transport system substrate-binding protein